MAKVFRVFITLFSCCLFALAARELWRADWKGAVQAAARMDAASLGIAALLIVASFLLIALYDHLAWIWHGNPGIPFRVVLRISFVATCAAMNVGISALSGSALRLTMYGEQGFDMKTVATVYVRIMLLFAVGWLIWLGIGLGFAGSFLAAQFDWPVSLFTLLACGGLAAAAIYLGVCFKKLTLRIGNFSFAAPTLGFALLHLAVSAADILTSAGVFYVLLPHSSISFIHSTAMFMLANTAGMASQIPGGLGIFEWIALELSNPSAGDAQILGGLLVFRFAFFWIPLLLAMPLAFHRRHRR